MSLNKHPVPQCNVPKEQTSQLHLLSSWKLTISPPPYMLHNQPKLYINNILLAAWRHPTRTLGPITCIYHNNKKCLSHQHPLFPALSPTALPWNLWNDDEYEEKADKSESTKTVKCVMQQGITMNAPGFNPDVFQTQGEHITEDWINLVKRISGTQN